MVASLIRLRGFARIAPVAIAVLAVGALGGAHLFYPFHGDAALFQLGARVIAGGGRLYVDFWDLKKPGIYLFHLAAGSLFGFSELGAHALELCYMTAFAAVMVVATRSAFARPALACLGPILTIGAYYLHATDWHLMQPAVLATFPCFLCLWANMAAKGPRRRRIGFSLLAGAAAAAAVLYKLSVAPIPLSLTLASAAMAWRHEREPLSTLVLERFVPAAAGLVAVHGAIALWSWRHGIHAEVFWTAFHFNAEATAAYGRVPLYRLRSSIEWFATTFAPLTPLAAFVVLDWRGLPREPLFVHLVVWLVAGSVGVAIDRFGWWPFDMLLLLVPLGLLAARGIDAALARMDRSRRLADASAPVFALALSLLALDTGLARFFARKVPPLVELARAERGVGAVRTYQQKMSASYARVWPDTELVREAASDRGAVYAFGNPLYILLAARHQAVPVNGWACELLVPAQWRELERALREAAPPYLFVETPYRRVVESRSPAIMEWLTEQYEPIHVPSGTWFRRARTTAPR